MTKIKRKLAIALESSRFGKAQFIKAILYLLQDRWLAPLLTLTLLGCMAGVATFLNLWKTTPKDFEPVIKISLFDAIQSHTLAKAAREHESTGNLESAAQGWRAAIAKDPGNLDLLQRFLNLSATIPPTQSASQLTLIYADWLLRLTEFAPTEVDRVAKALAHQRKYPRALMLLKESPSPLSQQGEAVQLQSLFWLGQYGAFIKKWEAASAPTKESQLNKLFHLATQAIVTPEKAHYEAFVQASEGYEPYSAEFLPVRRLAIRVNAASQKRHRCFAVLEDLRKRKLATLADYFPYWALLNHLGETEEIKKEYQEAPEPASEGESQTLVLLLRQAGHSSEAFQVSEEMLATFNNPISLWLEHGNYLIANQQWGKLKSLAAQIIHTETLAHLWSVSHYWKGVAEWFLDDREKSYQSFQTIAEFPLISLESAWEVAIQLRRFEAYDAANAILSRLEEPLANLKDYWLVRCQNARDAGDLEALYQISKKAYERDPEHPDFINNYVAALLTLRSSPELALDLMKPIIEQFPDSIPYRVNHLHALVQNRNLEQAERDIATLGTVEWANPELQSDFHLARFELALAKDCPSEALEIYNTLNREALITASRNWIEKKATELR